MLNNNNKILSIIIINLFYYIVIFNGSINHINFSKEYPNINKLKSFIKFCSNPNTKIKNFEIIKNPKISIISPIYNREKYLTRFLKNLEYQNFKDIEIILVDDFSKDNSIKLIKEFQKKDKRIILIKNRKNKGTFITRNIGVLFSKGKYLSIPDPDDFLSKDILNSCYKLAERYNYDIIRFNIVYKNGKLKFYSFINSIENGPIYQPELSNYLFHGSNKLRVCDNYIYNKIIKKEIFIKALNSIDKFYLNIYITFYEDGLINYFIHLSAKSLYFLKKIGYFYMPNNEGVVHNKHYKYKKLKAKFFFIYLKFVFEYSKNNQYFKDSINAIFHTFKKDYRKLNRLTKSSFKKDIYFYKNFTNKLLYSTFINNSSKQILQKIKRILDRKSLLYFHKKLF
jgi:glycosyltransferase involved in cell wall biosynthesis